jgi:1-acyl-sn-glycerol-3-phosphate acyltransferase
MATTSHSSRPFGPLSRLLRMTAAGIVILFPALVYMALGVLLIPWRHARIRLANVYGKIVGPAVVRIVGARARFTHRERINEHAPAIYLFNHTSQIDLFLSIWLCPMGGCGTAKKQITKLPFLGWAWWLSGHIMIDRSNRERAIAAMENVKSLMNRYQLSVWISPEGTASRDGRLLPFKKGFAHLALATKLPIVPVIFEGAHLCCPARTWALYGGDFNVKVLEPISTTDWTRETLDQHIATVHALMSNALNEEQRAVEPS